MNVQEISIPLLLMMSSRKISLYLKRLLKLPYCAFAATYKVYLLLFFNIFYHNGYLARIDAVYKNNKIKYAI